MALELPGIRARAELDLSQLRAQQQEADVLVQRLSRSFTTLPTPRLILDNAGLAQGLEQAAQLTTRGAQRQTATVAQERSRQVAQEQAAANRLIALEEQAQAKRAQAIERASAQVLAAQRRVDDRQHTQAIAASKRAQAEFDQALANRGPTVVPHLDDKALRTEVAGLRGFMRDAFGTFGGLGSIPGLGFLTTAPQLVGAATIGAALGALAKQAVDMGLAYDQAFRQIAVGTGATGANLDSLRQSFTNVAAGGKGNLEDISAVIAQLAVRTGATGPPLEQLTAQVVDFSRVAGGDAVQNGILLARVFESWGIAVENRTATLDKFVKSMQLSGEAPQELIEALSRSGPVFRNLGLGLDDAVSFLIRLREEGVPASETMRGLRGAVDNLAGSGKPTAQAFRELLGALTAMQDDTERTAVAIQTFGPGMGNVLADLARKGKLDLHDLSGEINNSAGSMAAALTALQTPALEAKFAFVSLTRELAPAGAELLKLAKVMTDEVVGGIKQMKSDLPGAIAGIQEFIARVGTGLADLDTLRAQAGIPLPELQTDKGPTGVGSDLAKLANVQDVGHQLGSQVMDQFAHEVAARVNDPGLVQQAGGDGFQRFWLGLFAPEKLAAALKGISVADQLKDFTDRFVTLAENAGAETGIAYSRGFDRASTDLRDATDAVLGAQAADIARGAGRLQAAGINAGALLLQGYEQGLANTEPDLFAKLAEIKERIAGNLTRTANPEGQKDLFTNFIATNFGAIPPEIADQMWAQIVGRSKALAATTGQESGKAVTDQIVEQVQAGTAQVRQSIDAIFAAVRGKTIDLTLELSSPTTSAQRIQDLLKYQTALQQTQSVIGSLTNKEQAAAVQYQLNAGHLQAAAGAAQTYAAQQQVLGARAESLASSALPALNARQQEFVAFLKATEGPLAAAQEAMQLLGVSSDLVRTALDGSGTAAAEAAKQIQRIAETADPAANAQKDIEASAKSMLDTLTQGLPASDKAWVQYVAAREGNRNTLRTLYEAMGEDLQRFDRLSAQGQQQAIQSAQAAISSAQTFRDTGNLVPAQQAPDVVRDIARAQATADLSAARVEEDRQIAASRLAEDRAQGQADFAAQAAGIDQTFQEAVSQAQATLNAALTQVDAQRGAAITENVRTTSRAVEDSEREFARQQRDQRQQDAETVRAFSEQGADLLVGMGSALSAAAGQAVQGLVGLSGSALAAAAAGVVEQFQGASDAVKQMNAQVAATQGAMVEKIRTTFEQVNSQAAATNAQVRQTLTAAGEFATVLPSLFGQGAITVTTARGPLSSADQAAQKQAKDQQDAILKANLAQAATATQQQAILDNASKARSDIDKAALATEKDTQKQLVELQKQAGDQRKQMIAQLVRMVEALQRGAFTTAQQRLDERFDRGLRNERQAEDTQRAIASQLAQLTRQAQEAQAAATRAGAAAAHQRDEQLRQLERQRRDTERRQQREDADRDRTERRRLEDARRQAAERGEELARARRQEQRGEAILERLSQIRAVLDRHPAATFDVHDAVFVEPTTEFLERAARIWTERTAAAAVG